MMRTVEISEETYHRLEALAQTRGIGVEQILEQLAKQSEVLWQEEAIVQREQRFWEELRNKGVLVQWPAPIGNPPEPFEPIRPQPGSKPASDVIIEDRR